jgi:CRISPR/Cas system-associated exonuclease Cas4 (RecB family)
MSQFNFRSSAVGGYSACERRLAMDRAIFDGMDPAVLGLGPGYRGSSPPADFGSCVHWYTQAALRCDFKNDQPNDFTFKGYDEARAKAATYSPQQWASGVKLFLNESVAQQTMHKAAVLAISRLPRKDAKWLAEAHGVVQELNFGGHIDLLTDDLDDIVDIKTTGRVPEDGKMHVSHMWQVTGYALLVEKLTGHRPKRAHILYVDRHAEWVCRTQAIKFETDEGKFLLETLETKLRTWNTGPVDAAPKFGPHCDECFCPYRPICRDAILPGGASIVRAVEAPITVDNPFKDL